MYVDLLLLFIAVFLTLMGFIHGFVRQILSILTLLAVVFFAHPLALWLKNGSGWHWFQTSPVLVLWGMTSLSILLFSLFVGWVVNSMRKNPELTPTDRWLGGAFGLTKGLVVIYFVGVLFQVLPSQTREHFKELDQDAKNSMILKASAYALNWTSLGTIQGLREIHFGLKTSENPKQVTVSPWETPIEPH